jgi:hypothetical protein
MTTTALGYGWRGEGTTASASSRVSRLFLSVDCRTRAQPLLMLVVLILDCADAAYRGRPKCADLLRPASLPFGQGIDNAALAHVALHPRRPRIAARAVDAQADTQRIQDAAQRPQCLEQVRSLGRPAPAIRAGDR